MIVINKKLVPEVRANALASGRINEHSVSKAYLLQSTVHLNLVYDATNHREDRLPKYSEKEFAVAETIHWLIAYLDKLGCKDIERLLEDVAAYRAEHPDYPKRPWPY